MEGDTPHQQVSPSTSKTLQELAADGKKQLETVVEIAHQILLSLNEALCSPSFWVAPSSSHLALESSSVSSNSLTAVSDPAAGAGRDSGGEGEAGLAALEATSLRYKVATAALRATVASILNTPQMRQQEDEGTGGVPVEMETGELDDLEQRVTDLRKEVMKKNQFLKLQIDQLRNLIADISMWQSQSL
ncbi:unnamed protein product [Sphagnum jensenii]|uniref:Mediator of RNA polymerase II transcription subunit 30 n=1 Tax=Sphagnum jensenii TaxID=128206 RepID=A0ABP1C222_9BRYO